ncbi:hypothetical protein [Methylobacterium frigidaeris]|uniref:Uncharacterized protein n=1 Tax=Methylobacterium frigidaeris TaxID=2038277 RepID=A0AA37H7C9_9HYPH|nr:hypothetical protein [Methylobacterium frigidaeris]PIK72950.1 hypothetical protein CS379_11110 [Methylobacterium frigidaeris]GJD60792.1 hypothetical protein MPEAHAMD_0931 [Methylobacterium frigidaeris]
MSKRRFSPIPAWLRRRGYSPRAKLAIASAVERSARRRGDAEAESRCQIIPFPSRPLPPIPRDALGAA